MAKITLVDDDENIVASVSLALESLGHTVKGYHDGVAGLCQQADRLHSHAVGHGLFLSEVS